jgi:NADPH:quinone reductase-like Zn-dependent oxidoreductase
MNPHREEVEMTAPTLPDTMRAAVVDAAGPPEAIHIARVPVPKLKRGHVIIALDYASVGSWDGMLRKGAWGPVKHGTILGADGSGTVAAVAPGVERLRAGDRVYSYSYDNPEGGFYAEYVSVPAERVEHVPAQLDQAVAGAMPCVALTAHTGLRKLKVRTGQRLLVFGASGGVGSLAVWLASGTLLATVTATARPDAEAYVLALGAAHIVDPYAPERDEILKRVAPLPPGFEAALITAGGDSLSAFLARLGPHAELAYPNGVEPKPHAPGHRAHAYDGEMARAAFERLNEAIGARPLPLRLEVFPFEDVVGAHRRLERGHVIGKLVLRIDRAR